MNKLNKLALTLGPLRRTLQPIRNSSHGHAVKSVDPKSLGPVKRLLTKMGYWEDAPMYPERWIYRNNYGTGGWQLPKKQLLLADAIMTFFWFWVFWHIYHDYGHLIGHFYPPDPSVWTDEELGIPPDDVE